VVGFEDLDNEVACEDTMAAGLEDGVGKETPKLQIDHVSAHEDGGSDGSQRDHRNSLARSKAASSQPHMSGVQGLVGTDVHPSIHKEVIVVKETHDGRANSNSSSFSGSISNSNSNSKVVNKSLRVNECSPYEASDSRTKTVSFS